MGLVTLPLSVLTHVIRGVRSVFVFALAIEPGNYFVRAAVGR